MLKKLLLIISFVIVITFQTLEAKAAWGDFDTTFGFQGAVLDTQRGYYPLKVAMQPDGKILVTGYKKLLSGQEQFFLRRYLSDGQLDSTFGNNGTAVSNAFLFGKVNYRGTSIVVFSNGKIAVAGAGNGYHAVWQFNSNGYGDSTIGSGGFRSLSSYPIIGQPVITVQNNKLILGVSSNGRAVLLRLNTNGSLDKTFGDQGEVVTDVHGSNKYVVVENETDKITVGGSHWQYISYTAAERKLPDGQNDSSFVFTSTQPGGFGPAGFIRLANRKYLARFYSRIWGGLPGYNTFVAYGTNGEYEPTVRYQTDYLDEYDKCPGVLAEQSDGKIVMTGNGKLYRFDSDLDPNTAQTRTCLNSAVLTGKTSGVLQTDDKMIFAGRYNDHLVIVRFLAN